MKKLSRKKLKEEFNEFLRKENCASKFYANFYHPKAKRRRKKHMLLHNFDREAINYAFDWFESKASDYYWSCLNLAWKRKYKKLTQK